MIDGVLVYNLDQFQPKLVEDLQIRFLKKDERGEFYILGVKGASSYLRIHEVGKEIIELLDGKTSVMEINESLKKKGFEVDLENFIVMLGENGLLENFTHPKVRQDRERLRIHYLPLFRKMEFILNKIHPIVTWLFRREVLLGFTLFSVGTFLFFAIATMVGYISLQELLFFNDSAFLAIIVYLFAITPFLIFTHELAHAAACFHYGGKPQEIGVAFYIFIPFFYVDTSDAWILGKKRSIMVYLAGPLCTFSIGGIFFLTSLWLHSSFHDLLLMTAFWSYMLTLIGFNPILETDGYYILQTTLDFPNLHSHAWRYVFSWLKRGVRLLSQKEYEEYLSLYSRHERKILNIYAPAVLIFNAIFLLIVVYWGMFLIKEYFATTYLILRLFPNVEALTLVIWITQSIYLALLFVYVPYRVLQKLYSLKSRKP